MCIDRGWLWPAGSLVLGAALVLGVELQYQWASWRSRRG